jgi:N-acetylmuramoyl-L-alanine amidase
MRALRLATLLLLAWPAAARAGDVALVQRDLPLGAERGLADAASPHFNMLGLHWRGSGRVLYRVHRLHGRWGPWLEGDADTAPDATSSEARATSGWQDGNLVWTGAADGLRYRTVGAVRRLRSYFLWSRVSGHPLRRLSLAGTPSIVTRQGWDADEDIRRAKPQYAPAVRFAVVHHTAGSNAYSPSQSAAIVRGIEAYHVKANGWNDIGYNFLVDRYGQVFEGRYGGMDRPVIGAHAQGFNTGSVGISLIGTYNSASITPAQRMALVKLLSWRLDVAHVDPLATLVWPSSGNPKFRAGKKVTLRTISGHRDTGFTDCPGNALYRQLPSIAKSVAASGLPKLYDPAVAGRLGGKLRFTGRLSTSLAWTVRITDAKGAQIAAGTGTGTAVDWTWDSSRAPKGVYAWSIEAPGARPAKGSLGGTISGPTLSALTATPTIVLPSAPGSTGSTTLAFTLGTSARVTVSVLDGAGVQLATLLDEPLEAGSQTVGWAAGGFPDGRYTLRVTARPTGKPAATASVQVVVDRTVTGFSAVPLAVSPNGDGVSDATTLTFGLAAPATVRLDIVANGLALATPLAPSFLQPGTFVLGWDGSVNGAAVPDGTYAAVLTVTGLAGDVAIPLSIQVDTTAPVLDLLDPATLRFRLSEPATVTLVVNGTRIVRVEPAGVFTVHRGSVVVRSLSASAADAAGNVSSTVQWP